MSEPFVPLSPSPASPSSTAFRLQIIPGTSVSKPLSSPRPAPRRPATSTPALPELAPTINHSHEPTVTLQREGDRVSGAQIHCSCGQVIELTFTF